MGRSCGTYGVQERCIQVYGRGDLMERDHLVDRGVDVRIILQWVFKKWVGQAWTELLLLRIETSVGRL
jgi:hypothetical protein